MLNRLDLDEFRLMLRGEVVVDQASPDSASSAKTKGKRGQRGERGAGAEEVEVVLRPWISGRAWLPIVRLNSRLGDERRKF